MTERNRPMTTDHLIIRQSCWDDLEDFYRWERMPEVTEFFSIRDGQTKEDVKAHSDSWQGCIFEKREYFFVIGC